MSSQRFEPTTIPHALQHWAASSPSAPALRHESVELTYRSLADQVDRAAGQLIVLGVRPGDGVVLVGGNTRAWVVAYLAALRLGAIIAPANARLNPAQFAQQCTILDAVLVLHDDDHVHLATAVGEERRTVRVDELLAPLSEPPDLPGLPAASDIALVSFTSGTTGTPKGVVLTHDALTRASCEFRRQLGTGPADSTLVLVPIFHNTGFVDQLGHMLVAGGRTDLMTRFRTGPAIELFAQNPVTVIIAVPSILRLLMVHDDAAAAFAQARVILFGGSPMPGAWTRELLERWPHLTLVHAYGMTEFTSVCTFLPPHLITEKGESVGLPAHDVAVRVVDPEGRTVPAMTEGEVWVAGPMRMHSYWRQPELTAAKLHGEWLRTGDLGRLDDDGLLWLSGRVDDAINRGGEKVLPAFVESCLAEHPAIADSVVFGFDDPVLQHRIAAAVQLRNGSTLDEAAVTRSLRHRLPDYAVPERWVVYPDLPRNASGKVDRRVVADDFAHGRLTVGQEA